MRTLRPLTLLLVPLLLLLALHTTDIAAQDTLTETKAVALPAENAVGSHMPERVRGLLTREMMALQAAMNAILDALIRGNDDVVAVQAQAVQDSFILKQEMTPEDRKGLMASVPESFVTRDRAFHALGGRLAEAARDGDQEAQLRLYGDLVTACAECHSVHAQDKFPAFAP